MQASAEAKLSERHVVIIGAGIVGACAASYLQRDGHRVTLVDMMGPGEGATLGNAGGLNASSITPVAMPGTLWNVPRWLFDPMGPLTIRWSYLPQLLPWLWRFVRAGTPAGVQQQARALRPLTQPTVEMHRELARAAGVADLIHQAGLLVVYKSDAGFAGDDGAMALRQANGVAIDALREDEIRQLEPALARDYTRGRMIQENGHCADPRRLARGLVEHVQRNGGRLVQAKASGFRIDGRRVAAVTTDQGEIAGDEFVLACGAWSKRLAAALGDRLPLDTERGYHVVIKDPEVETRRPIMSYEGKFVATPMEMGLRVAGTVEFGGLEMPPDWRRAAALVKHAQAMFPALPRAIPESRLTRWMGFRPSMPDSLPVLGRATKVANAIHAFGHGHIGVIAAPMSGRVVADLVAGRAPAIDIAAFRPERF
jgi:D-amino-acid dehydrogenase